MVVINKCIVSLLTEGYRQCNLPPSQPKNGTAPQPPLCAARTPLNASVVAHLPAKDPAEVHEPEAAALTRDDSESSTLSMFKLGSGMCFVKEYICLEKLQKTLQ